MVLSHVLGREFGSQSLFTRDFLTLARYYFTTISCVWEVVTHVTGSLMEAFSRGRS
jgi:hypothetical protein